MAVINVGAQTEPEMKEKKDRVDEAYMLRVRLLKKVSFRGGVALLRAAKAIETAAAGLE